MFEPILLEILKLFLTGPSFERLFTIRLLPRLFTEVNSHILQLIGYIYLHLVDFPWFSCTKKIAPWILTWNNLESKLSTKTWILGSHQLTWMRWLFVCCGVSTIICMIPANPKAVALESPIDHLSPLVQFYQKDYRFQKSNPPNFLHFWNQTPPPQPWILPWLVLLCFLPPEPSMLRLGGETGEAVPQNLKMKEFVPEKRDHF